MFIFLLVVAAKLLPLEELRPVIEQYDRNEMGIGRGVLSAFFDNIPLTSIAIDIGGFDWALLAFAVGVGGSAIWFGSSAGVAVTGEHYFPELHDTARWIRPYPFLTGVMILSALWYIFFWTTVAPMFGL